MIAIYLAVIQIYRYHVTTAHKEVLQHKQLDIAGDASKIAFGIRTIHTTNLKHNGANHFHFLYTQHSPFYHIFNSFEYSK